MKKLMIALSAAAAAIFAVGTAHGDEIFSAVGFEDYSGTAFDASKTDDGTSSSGNRYWFSTSNDGNVISNYDGVVNVGKTGVGNVPNAFKDDATNNKFLYLDTTAPLYRSVNPNQQDPAAFTGQSIGDGIYLDTLVKFTPADAAFEKDLDDGDKIAIEYVECDAETDPNGEGYTNFVIRAGYLGNELTQKNYLLAVPEGFNKDNWYRLTVRTIANIDGTGEGKGHVGFVVYLDRTALAYDQTDAIGDNFTPAPGVIEDLHAARTIFPSAVNTTDVGYNTISAASFSGTGAIDDVVFTSVKPEFINEASTVTITWDTNAVSSISIAGTAITGVDFEAQTATVPLTGETIEVIATPATGYELVFTPPENGGWNASSHLFTGLAANDICNVSGIIPNFDVGGTHYEDLSDAIDAAVEASTLLGEPVTLKLLADCEEAMQFSEGSIILDLAGHDIQAESGDFSIGNIGATLIITNSGAEASVKVPDGGTGALATAAGFTTIQAGTFDGLVATAADMDETFPQNFMSITGGKFLDAAYDPTDPEAPFYLASCVAQGIGLSKDGDYVQVGEAPVPPTTYALTLPTVTGATAAVTAGGVAVADRTAIPENTEVVVTWTAEDGYKITAGATETITMDGNKTAASPTVEAITYATLTITPVENCTIVVSNATEEVATGAKFDVADAVQLTVYRTPAEGYELDNCAASETITMDQDQTVTAAVKQSGGSDYPNYIPDNAAAKEKYDAWKALYGDDTGSAYEDAFLLNCAPANVETEKAAFKLNITVVGDTVTVTTPDGKTYNGTVQLKGSNDLTTWTNVESASKTYQFYKAELQSLNP